MESSPVDITESHFYAVYVPYLPLASRIRIGAWDLIPQADLQESDTFDARVAEWCHALAALHALPESARGVGAFGRPVGGRIGDDPADRSLMDDLRRALVVAIIDGNESPLIEPDERDPNAGHWAMSSENANVTTYGIDYKEGWTATRTGGRIPWLSLGIPLRPARGLPVTPIQPPADLRLPTMSRSIDHEYADAVWESIRRGTDDARRLARAIEWLRLAWLNTSDLTPDLRIPALRSGFEALLDGEKTPKLARSLRALLSDDSPSVVREWTHTRTKEPTCRALTDIEWWFWKFSFLRNELMHGGEPSAEAWAYDGRSQLDLGSGYLTRAIKLTVINDGHSNIRDDLMWRRAIRETRARLYGDD